MKSIAKTRLGPYGAPAPWYQALWALNPAARHDGSLASRTENWIVEQLTGIPQLVGARIEPWPGSDAPNVQLLVQEMERHGRTYVAVLFEGDVGVELQEGENAYDARYAVFVVKKNERPSGARRGDGSELGTNLLRDLLRGYLHDAAPATTAHGYFTDRLQFAGIDVVWQSADQSVCHARVTAREVPAAS